MANKKIYIVGKITGDPEYKHKFAIAEKRLTHQGNIVFSPARLPDGLKYEEYMYIDLAMITVCDAVYMLPCWSDSPGATREKNFAGTIGKEIIFAPELVGTRG